MTEADKMNLKISVMGGGGVGKSNLSLRLIQGRFVDNYDPTIEDSYFSNNFTLDGEVCPLEILDTAGQDQYGMMMDIYYKSSDAFVFVYSITDKLSLGDARGRYEALKNYKDVNSDPLPPIILVGNKCDLESERVISREDGERLAREMGEDVMFEETSAKADINVTEVFQNVARKAVALKKAEVKQIKKKKKHCCIV